MVIPLYNFREGDRGGELREIKYLQKVPVLRSNTTKDESVIIIHNCIITSLTKGIIGFFFID